MPMSNYPNGFLNGIAIRGIPILNTYSGNVYWVDSNGTTNDNFGGSRTAPFSSLENAFNHTSLTAGDIVMLKPGHVETVIAAGGLDLDVAGVCVIFMGQGTNQAYVTFTTSAGADMDIDAANITLVNPRFVAGVDSLTGPIDVNSTDFTIVNGKWEDATDIETLDCIVATAGATRLTIDGWKFQCGTETADLKQSNIQVNGCDDIELKNIDVRGDFYVGCIENVTDEVLNARLKNVNLENLNATPTPALYLDANATGHCENVQLHVASGTTYANSFAKMAWGPDCLGFSGTSAPAGDSLGTAAGGSGSLDSISSDVVIIQSDLKILDPIIDTIASDLVVTNAIVDTIASDLVVLDGIGDTIASDLVILDTVADTIASDLIVLDAVADNVYSDTTIILSDLKAFRTAFDTFETIMSDFVVKYASDVP